MFVVFPAVCATFEIEAPSHCCSEEVGAEACGCTACGLCWPSSLLNIGTASLIAAMSAASDLMAASRAPDLRPVPVRGQVACVRGLALSCWLANFIRSRPSLRSRDIRNTCQQSKSFDYWARLKIHSEPISDSKSQRPFVKEDDFHSRTSAG